MREVWVFDVDGCLIDAMTGRSLRPLAAVLLGELRERGAEIVLWSAAGAEYARRKAAFVGIAELVAAFYAKTTRDAAGRWSAAHLAPEHRAATFIDDMPDEAPHSPRLIPVSPYIAENAHDGGLEPVLELVRASIR
ncbi:MAG TPA: NIF family HAD-type phosphatase [Myxococcota bacterium]|nr:NIF family HAD-type phosphatase [Myxococcota bacterium]